MFWQNALREAKGQETEMIKPTSPPQQPMTFRHAGDAGDIIYALPAIKYMVGNQQAVLFIEAAPYTRQRMTPENWHGLDALLKAQPYIADVLPWNREQVLWNLNDFRATMVRQLRQGQGRDRHITDWVAITHNLPLNIKDAPWLTVEPNRIARVVVNRAGAGRPPHQQYYGKEFPWGLVLEKYGSDAVFIGTKIEHEVFCAAQGKIPHYPTATLFDAAKVIAGADLFIGNQSSPHAIAQGLGKPIILEVWHQGANCLGKRPSILNVWDYSVQLPELVDCFPVAATTEPTPPMPTEPPSETSRYRHIVSHLCAGNGADLGSAGDPVVPHAINVDLPEKQYRIYNVTRPYSVIQWRGTALDLPFKDGTLDWLNSSHLLEDFPLEQWQAILNEWSRVLKPGGHLIISVPDHERFRYRVKHMGQGENNSHRHESKPLELTGFLVPMGYDVLRDSFFTDDPHDYSILCIARKK